MLSIQDLHASIDDNKILNGLNLEIKPGEVHAIMGPNGAGKSTLTQILAGNEDYTIDNGSVNFEGSDLLEIDITERALEGIFVSFQSPPEIPGVVLINFLKQAYNNKLKHQGKEELDTADFLKLIKIRIDELGLAEGFYKNELNNGLSGGQKKMSELLQLSVLEPKLAIIDEIDSGLDVDSLKLVASNLEKLKTPDRSFLIITHYQRILDYFRPNFVHILQEGKIVESGGFELVEKIENQGYHN